MSKVLVTGAKGMLGTDLCRIFQEKNYDVVITDIEELDVRNTELVRQTIAEINPDWVIHLAALTDVDGCEREPGDSYHTNTIGTQNVALACQSAGAGMLYVSTISVFDGTKCEPYTEFDKPNPESWYSRSKYEGELIVEKLLDKYYIVRAGWMFGGGREDKKFVAKIIELAAERPSLSIVDDKFGSPTYTVDIATGIEKLLNTGLFGTYHLVNTNGYCNRYEFAKAILAYAGIDSCELIPVNSAKFPLPAPRPRMEAALNYNLELRGMNWQRSWQDALKEYIQEALGYGQQ
ncbi:MAG: dTDP-4-dehydrorhamnose reductase [Chloroflexi bacterium]|nr:MAG: dTDP-4-dehydrorhamnose reductase [Chloroflexota bacterium]